MISLLLVDDHPILRLGFRMVLDTAQHEFKLVAEVSNGADAQTFLRRHHVDVVVVDIELPGTNGFVFLEHARQRYPSLGILIYSAHSDSEYAMRALRNGADGYLAKDSEPEELLKAIRQVAAGRGYLSPEAIALAGKSLRGDTLTPAPHEQLSTREYEIFKLIIKGKKVSQIATNLGISAKTASSHRVHVLNKLGVDSTVGLVNYAIEHHLEN